MTTSKSEIIQKYKKKGARKSNGTSEVVGLMLKSKKTAKLVVDLLNDKREGIRSKAAKSIALAAKINPKMFQNFNRRLVKKLFDSTFQVVRYTTEAISHIAPRLKVFNRQDTIQQLTELLSSDSVCVRESALVAIGRINYEQKSVQDLAFRSLSVGLRDDNLIVRKKAIMSMSEFCRNNNEYISRALLLMKDMEKDSKKSVSQEARRVIKNMKLIIN
ncbi:HEAT repeat domain-containing protein [Patescibacteria group bacterium]|nr:HEAT repeat domain-containing protein [Patescibacteria group bacterium]MBU1890817.1 HEAT repeat domain-containing protein [Patescibacteria group bacterium]